MTAAGFVDLWGMLTATFGQPGRNEEEADAKGRAYRLALGDVDDGPLTQAVGRCLRECARFPLPKDILERLPGRLTEGYHAEAAWQRCLRSVRYGPESYSPASGTTPTGADLDAATFSAVGGAAGLYRIMAAEQDAHQMGFLRRDFLATYEAVCHMHGAGLLPTGEVRPELVGVVKRVPALLPGKDGR